MEKAHETKDLDVKTAARGVWLVKVPKYLSEKWEKAAGQDVGKLKISKPRFAGGKQEVIFSLNDSVHQMETSIKGPVPKDHKFVLTGMATQHLSVLSQTIEEDDPTGQVALEGKVIQRAECRPHGDAGYMNLKRIQLEASNRPTRQVVQLDRVVNSYKPVAYHSGDLNKGHKKEVTKRARDEKDVVMDRLFALFEKHQYYNIKNLVEITRQPITYLKEILREICIYNMKAPHKNLYELKPEYRHYKDKP